MCEDSGERMVNVWVLNDKGKKTLVPFLVDGYELETNTVYQFHGYMPKESYKKARKEI